MKVVVRDPNLVPHRERLEAALPPGTSVHWHDATRPGLLDDLRDADVFVGSRFDAEMAGAAEKLRLVHTAGAGTDKIAFDALAQDVLVANTFHHEQSIAEYVLAAAVLLRRGFLEQDWALREGIWATSVYDSLDPSAEVAAGRSGGVCRVRAHRTAQLAVVPGVRLSAARPSPAAAASTPRRRDCRGRPTSEASRS